MKNEITLAGLTQQWPDLKKRIASETDPAKSIALLIEVEDFLQRLEAQVVANDKERLRMDAELYDRAVRTGIGSA
jgi:hypothetical protein